MYKLLVLAGLLTVAAAAHKNLKCPWVFGKYPFDEQRFSGEWKVYAKTTDHPLPHCAKAEYQIGKDGTTTITMAGKYEDGKAAHGEAFGQPMFPGKPEKSANLLVVYRKDGAPYSGVFKQSVVTTDYENYALVVACKPTFDEATKTFSRELYAKILYRPDRTLSQDTIHVLTNLLTGYDIDTSLLKMVDHSKC